MTKNQNWFWINKKKKSTFVELPEATKKLNNVFKILEKGNFKAKILYPAKLSTRCESRLKTFQTCKVLTFFF